MDLTLAYKFILILASVLVYAFVYRKLDSKLIGTNNQSVKSLIFCLICAVPFSIFMKNVFVSSGFNVNPTFIIVVCVVITSSVRRSTIEFSKEKC